MMNTQAIQEAKYQRSGEDFQWVCPRCGSILARVCQTPRFQYIGGHGYLLLRGGFVFARKLDRWLIPKGKFRPDAGPENKRMRQLMQGRKSEELRRAEEILVNNPEQLEEVLNTDHLPTNIQCPHDHCATLLKLPSVRGFTV